MKKFLQDYKGLFATNPHLMVYGFIITFYSSFGQTYFIGVFGPQIQSDFNLTNTLWGVIYMIGTLLSALLMPITGAMIDTFNLNKYALAVSILLVSACAFISFAPNLVFLIIGIFLLRHFGQGLASHVGITSMARYFKSDRGRAIAFASLGYSVGEASLPFLGVILIAILGWRSTYLIIAIFIAITLIPSTIFFLKNHQTFHKRYFQKTENRENILKDNCKSWTRGQMLRDVRFYLMLPGILSPALIITALFFHHLNIADSKGWTGEWLTGTYVIYAITGTITMLIAGQLIDKYRATSVIQFMLFPLAIGCFLLSITNNHLGAIPYMFMLGIHTGFAHTTISALWAELYGVKYLGTIKSFYMAMMVIASAIGPPSMGFLIDTGLSIPFICIIFGLIALSGNLLLMIALRYKNFNRKFTS